MYYVLCCLYSVLYFIVLLYSVKYNSFCCKQQIKTSKQHKVTQINIEEHKITQINVNQYKTIQTEIK